MKNNDDLDDVLVGYKKRKKTDEIDLDFFGDEDSMKEEKKEKEENEEKQDNEEKGKKEENIITNDIKNEEEKQTKINDCSTDEGHESIIGP